MPVLRFKKKIETFILVSKVTTGPECGQRYDLATMGSEGR